MRGGRDCGTTESLFDCGYCRQDFWQPGLHCTLSTHRLFLQYIEISGKDSAAIMETPSLWPTVNGKLKLVASYFSRNAMLLMCLNYFERT